MMDIGIIVALFRAIRRFLPLRNCSAVGHYSGWGNFIHGGAQN